MVSNISMGISFVIAGAIGLMLVLLLTRWLMITLGLRLSYFERFCCWIGWHWSTTKTGFDGASVHGRCNSCDKDGMFDSNGDFF